MIKLVIGIVLLILILVVARYIFVEREHFQGDDGLSPAQGGCTQNSIQSFLEDEEQSEDSFIPIKSCCPKIFSGSNDIKKILYDISVADDVAEENKDFQKNHLKMLSYCNKFFIEDKKVPLIENDCSEINKQDEIENRSVLCQINDKCILRDERVGMCKDKCPLSVIEDAGSCESPCVTNKVNEFQIKCDNYFNPIDCNNASIDKENGDNINVCSWNKNEFNCQSKCNELTQDKCNKLEFCSFSESSTCEKKTCDLPGMDEYCENRTYCGPDAPPLHDPTCHVRSVVDCEKNSLCEYDNNFIEPICTNRV